MSNGTRTGTRTHVRLIRGSILFVLAGVLTCIAGCSGASSPDAPKPVDSGDYFCSDRSGNYEVYHQHDNQLDMLTDDSTYDSWWPRQAPNGRTMLFYRSRVSDRPIVGGHNNNYDHASLWSLDLTTSSLTQLIAEDANGWSAQGVADWSPDGTQLVMAARLTTTGRWHLFVTNADGSNPVQVTTRESIFLDPSWSPDGTKIVYTAFPETAVGTDLAQLEIYVADADGTNEVRLTNDGLRDHDPYWSPDGNEIAFETAVDPTYLSVGRWAIRAIPPIGGTPRTVLDDGHINTLPRWSKDGTCILFHRFVFGSGHGFTVNSMATDGSDLQAISNGGAYDDSDVDWWRPMQ